MKQKTSAIWITPTDILKTIVQESPTLAQILVRLGFGVFNAWHYRALQSRLKQDGIDYSHIALGLHARKGVPNTQRLSKDEALAKWFVIGEAHYSNKHFIRFIKRYDLLKYECAKCGISEWLGEALSLQLDHISGNRKDNRLENFRWMCPNCHSQTPTFCSKNLSSK